jgi:hypothetical protein
MVTIGVTGRSVADGVGVGVWVGVVVGVIGVGVPVFVGVLVTVGVLVGVASIISKKASTWLPSADTARTLCWPGAAKTAPVGVVKVISKVPSLRIRVSPKRCGSPCQ